MHGWPGPGSLLPVTGLGHAFSANSCSWIPTLPSSPVCPECSFSPAPSFSNSWTSPAHHAGSPAATTHPTQETACQAMSLEWGLHWPTLLPIKNKTHSTVHTRPPGPPHSQREPNKRAAKSMLSASHSLWERHRMTQAQRSARLGCSGSASLGNSQLPSWGKAPRANGAVMGHECAKTCG